MKPDKPLAPSAVHVEAQRLGIVLRKLDINTCKFDEIRMLRGEDGTYIAGIALIGELARKWNEPPYEAVDSEYLARFGGKQIKPGACDIKPR